MRFFGFTFAGIVLAYIFVQGIGIAGAEAVGEHTAEGVRSVMGGGVLGGLALLTAIAVYVLNLERSRNALVISLKGIPWVVPIILILLVVLSFVLGRTAYGRHVYATGGNAEAARQLDLGTGVAGHVTPSGAWAGGSRCAGSA